MDIIPLDKFNDYFGWCTNFFPNIEKFSEYEEKINIEFVNYNNTYAQENNIYGDQEIFSRNSQIAIETVKMSARNGDAFDEILDYVVARRSLCAAQMGTENDHIFSQTRIDSVSGSFETPLVGNIRGECIEEMIKGMAVEGQILTGYFSFEGSEYYRAPDDANLKLLIDGKKAAFYSGEKIKNPDLSYESCKLKNGFFCIDYVEKRGPDGKYMEKLKNFFNTRDIPRLHWHMCIKTPVKRGGGAIAEWICAGLLKSEGVDFKDWNKKYDVWSVAVTCGIDRFVESYSSLFE